MMPGGPETTTEMKGERKRTTMTKLNTSNSSNLVDYKFFPWALNRFKDAYF